MAKTRTIDRDDLAPAKNTGQVLLKSSKWDAKQLDEVE
jgi:hypothetical protein